MDRLINNRRISSSIFELLTVKELSRITKLAQSTIYSMLDQIPHYNFGNRHRRAIRFKREEVLVWIAKHKTN